MNQCSLALFYFQTVYLQTMIVIDKLSVYFGGEPLFREISFLINKGDRIGLVGKNGAGKSTLLNILAGKQEPSEGAINSAGGVRVGYLPQDLDFVSGKTLMEEAESAFAELKELEKKMERLNEEVSTRTDYESESYMKLLEEMNEVSERFHLLGAHSFRAELERVLKGLGFKTSDFDKQTDTFSGGWRMRIELAKLLLQKNDVLLLDEPTNHLDIESIIWLEQFLSNYPGALVLVSHDRTFLDRVSNRTIEIMMGRIHDYKCSYSKYVTLRQERREQQLQAQKNQEKTIKHTEELIEKFRYKASKAAFAQSLIKKLDQMERIDVDEGDTRAMKLRFPPAIRSGKVVVRGERLSKHYGNKKVFEGVDFEIERGMKVAFVGQNGQGKTTLAKMIVNELDYQGKLELGHQVSLGYYAQNQSETLDGDRTVLQTIEDAADEHWRPKARNLLGSFLFSGEAVEKKVKVLSGGERGRLALCKLLLQPSNLLVLDEPTNHLDMRSKDILKEALLHFDQTLIVVSHDRDFLEGLADRVLEFKDGQVKEHLGGIRDFLESRQLDDFRQLESAGQKDRGANSEKASPKGKGDYERKKQLERDIRKMSNQLKKLEEAVDSLEKELAETDALLMDPEKFKELSAAPDFFQDYEGKKQKLDSLMEQWEEVQVKLEDLQKQRAAFN